MPAQVLVSTNGLSREEWLAARRRGLGGSDIGTICGLNPYSSPYALWLEKTGQVPPQEVDSEAALWGHLHEDTVAREFARRTGIPVRRRNAILQHPDHPWALANLDRVCVDVRGVRGVLECKTTGFARAEEWEGDAIPDAYLCQVSWYLGVTGAPYGYIACLIGGNKLVYKFVPRDETLIAELLQRGRDFWTLVETLTPPALDGRPATGEALDQQYPVATAGECELAPDTLALLAAYDAAKAQVVQASDALAALEHQLQALLGPHEAGRVGERLVSWKTVTGQRLDTKAFKAQQPELYATFTKPSVYRRFAVK